jgi:hypothetical protein
LFPTTTVLVIEVLLMLRTTLYVPELAYITLTVFDEVEVAGDPPLKVH